MVYEVPRRARVLHRPGLLAFILLADLVLFALAAGLAILTFADISHSATQRQRNLLPMVLSAVAFVWVIHVIATRQYARRELEPAPFVGVVPLFVIGAAFGGAAAPRFGVPTVEPLRTVLAGLAALALVGAIARRVTKRRSVDRVDDLRATGQLARGVVIRAPQRDRGRSTFGPIAVRYTDYRGVECETSEFGAWNAADRPHLGDIVSVLYDPNKPWRSIVEPVAR